MTKPKINQKRALVWRTFFSIALIAVAAFALTRYWNTVVLSLHLATHSNIVWTAILTLLTAATFFIAAALYSVLSLRRLRYRQTFLVELAGAFVNRLLPAGLGGLGLNGVYLYRRGHTPSEATAVVSVNNLLGIAAHFTLLVITLLYKPGLIGSLITRHHLAIPWGWVIAAGLLISLVSLVPPLRKRITLFASHLLVSFRKFANPGVILRAFALSALMTVVYTLALFAAAQAVDIHLGLLKVFIVFSAGNLLGTVTPTPGGLVGVELGLLTGFIAYGVSPALAGAAILLFRLATYWLPLLPGLAALLSARRLKLV